MRALRGGGSEMWRAGTWCGCGVIDERIRNEGRGERGEGGIESSLAVSITMSISDPKLNEALEERSRRVVRWGGSMDMVRWMGGCGWRRGESVARDAPFLDDGSTADDARGTNEVLRVEVVRLRATAGGSR